MDELWRGYDPRALGLEAETVEEWKTDAGTLRKVYYTSEIERGHKVRIVAYYGFPKAARKVPAVLHIHGGGQTASQEYVNFWVRRGYAGLSINWGGFALEGDQAKGNTDWGPLFVDATDGLKAYRTMPSARSNAWYHWAMAARRGLTFLEEQPEVDRARLGVLGISMGGRIAWLVAGSDARVKAAVSVYGAVAITEPVNGLAGSEPVVLPPEERAVWRATLDALAYAPKIRCPFFYLSSTNDFYGWMDQADRALGLIPHRQRWASFTPHYTHHIAAAQEAALPLWMDRWLKNGPGWPAGPGLRLELNAGDGVPRAVVAPELASGVREVSVYYSTEAYPQGRFWRSAHVEHARGRWIARLPLTTAGQGLFVFANVRYDSGLSLSTRLRSAAAETLRRAGIRAADPPALLIEDFQAGAQDWFTLLANPNLDSAERPRFRVVDGPDGARALQAHETQGSQWQFSTRKVGDAKWRGPAGSALQFRLRASRPNTVLAVAIENDGRPPKQAKVYVAELPVQGGDGWQTVTAPLESFRAIEGGERLTSWESVNLLSIQAQYLVRPWAADPAMRRTVGARWQGPNPSLAGVEWKPATGAR